MRIITTLWKFSRPHTVIGSMFSIVTLYMIICDDDRLFYFPLLLIAMAVGVTCNVFIVGINQIADIELDRINKPYLPIPAGKLSVDNARIIVYSSLFVSLALALTISAYLFYIILVAAFIGWAYSMPPFHLKKHHLTSALAITLVRGILINLGGFMVFNYIVNKSVYIPEDVRILTAFIIIFSLVISWFKDLPDMEGDSRHHIKTLALAYSARTAFITGNLLVVLTYLGTLIAKYPDVMYSVLDSWRDIILFYGHIVLLGFFLINSLAVDLNDRFSVISFYRRFWGFFFAEYALYFIAYS